MQSDLIKAKNNLKQLRCRREKSRKRSAEEIDALVEEAIARRPPTSEKVRRPPLATHVK